MAGLDQETMGCIYGITSEFEVAKVWVKSSGSVTTLEHQARGTNVVEAEFQDQPGNLFKLSHRENFRVCVGGCVREITREMMRHDVPSMIRTELKPIHHKLREINRGVDISTSNTRISKA